MTTVLIAVYDTDTGFIRQITSCPQEDAAAQHTAWPGHDYMDVTDIPDIDPRKNMVDIATKAIVPRTAPLVEMQDGKVDELTKACAVSIGAGFNSSALGLARFYPSNAVDQTNIMQAAQVGGDLWCRTGEIWALSYHTASQAQQVLTDFVAMRDAARTSLASKIASVNGASTDEAVAAITWSSDP